MRVIVHQFDGVDMFRTPPLAAGLLVATARARLALSGVAFSIVTARQPPAEVVDRMAREGDRPDVLAFSLYTWNLRYSLEVSRLARARCPEALIVLGGPSVPREPGAAGAMLGEHPWVDLLVLGEGETTFCELLEARQSGDDPAAVAGVASLDEQGQVRLSSPRPRMSDLGSTASPWLSGVFEELVGFEGYEAALVETNRGCPFSCTFCDWGQATGSRVVEFALERVRRELDEVGRRGLETLYIIDANFGIRPRDIEIVDHLCALRARTGYPRTCYFHLTKNAHRKNLATVERLEAASINCRMALSMQDFDPVVLEAIERSNIKVERSLELRELCHARRIPTFNELLLGLPAQTLASFGASLAQALTPFPGDTFSLYLARLLENAAMASAEHRQRYGLQTVRCVVLPADPAVDPHVEEYEEIVIATDAMPAEHWARAYRFGYLLSVLYNRGLDRKQLEALQPRGAVVAWMEALLDAIAQADADELGGRLEAVFERFVESIRRGEGMLCALDGLGPRRWSIEEALLLTIESDAPAFGRLLDAVVVQTVQDGAAGLAP